MYAITYDILSACIEWEWQAVKQIQSTPQQFLNSVNSLNPQPVKDKYVRFSGEMDKNFEIEGQLTEQQNVNFFKIFPIDLQNL